MAAVAAPAHARLIGFDHHTPGSESSRGAAACAALPTAQALAKRFSVRCSTGREVFRQVEQEGLLQRREGRRLFILFSIFLTTLDGRVRVAMNDCFADAQPPSGQSGHRAALEKLDLPVWVVHCPLRTSGSRSINLKVSFPAVRSRA